MKDIFFSIVIPTYNSESTIVRCIESCFNQTYANFEIIVVDDCSKDNTVLKLERYIQTHSIYNISIHKLKTNSGASTARNTGIKQSIGKYIALLDSDDFFHTDKLEIVHKILSNNHSIDLIGHSYYIEGKVNKSKNILDTSNMSLYQISCNKLLLKNFAVTPSIVFKRSINIYFNEKMRYTEDHDFFIRVCLAQCKIFYIDLPLVGLNRTLLSQGGQSSNNLKMRFGEIIMYANLYKIDFKYILIIPFLVFFSILKHLIRFLKR